MRSGLARRCASYCTSSSRLRATVLESADDQCWIPVTIGNFDNSRGLAGEVAPGLMLAGFAVVPADGAAGASLAPVPIGFGAIFSVRTILLANCDGFSFHQTLPANAEATTMHTSRTSMPGRRVTLS